MNKMDTNTSIDLIAQLPHDGVDSSEGGQTRLDPPINCAIYARTLRLRSGIERIESQIETCLAAASEQGLLIADEHIYCDQRNQNVTFRDRPGLKDLLDAARRESRQFDVVLIDNNSRLSRKSGEILCIYSALSKAGVKVKIVPKRSTDSGQ